MGLEPKGSSPIRLAARAWQQADHPDPGRRTPALVCVDPGKPVRTQGPGALRAIGRDTAPKCRKYASCPPIGGPGNPSPEGGLEGLFC